MIIKITPANTTSAPTKSNDTVVEMAVAKTLMPPGAITNTSSVVTESRANAVVRSGPRTKTPIDWRTTVKTGSEKTPAKNMRTSRTSKLTNGAAPKAPASTTIDGRTARRTPLMSTTRPRHGEPIAIPIVSIAVTRPAAAKSISNALRTCSVNRIAAEECGKRPKIPTNKSVGTCGRFRTRA